MGTIWIFNQVCAVLVRSLRVVLVSAQRGEVYFLHMNNKEGILNNTNMSKPLPWGVSSPCFFFLYLILCVHNVYRIKELHGHERCNPMAINAVW